MHDFSAQITGYQPNERAVELVRSTDILLLVGISGAGKDTVKNRLLGTGHYHDIITNTTRAPRINHGTLEQDGVQYHFTAMDDMIGMLDRQELIEVNQYGENLYGTAVTEFQRAHDEHKIAVADIDVNGVAAFVKIAPRAVRPVFLVPPDYDTWYARWQKRYGDVHVSHLDDLSSRRQTAIDELRHVLETPYYSIVVNADLDATVKEVDEIARSGEQTDTSRAVGRAAVQTLLIAMETV